MTQQHGQSSTGLPALSALNTFAPGAGVWVSREGAIATVTLSHPGRMNAITVSMWQALTEVFASLSADTSLRCVVVQGAGGHFAAGADIREFPEHRHDQRSVEHYHQQILAPALHAVQTCLHPTLALIEGVCVGGGLEIASHCDLRIAARSARFGVPINRLGFPMAPGELRGVLALAGRAVTLELLLEGRILGADEAYAKGLLTRVVDDADLAAEGQACTGRLTRGAPLAARLNKRMIRRLTPPADALSADELVACFAYADSLDHQEGVRAFLAGEEPHFVGR